MRERSKDDSGRRLPLGLVDVLAPLSVFDVGGLMDGCPQLSEGGGPFCALRVPSAFVGLW